MHWHGRERCEAIADYVIETADTVRGAALHFGISKSTVHKDLTEKLKIVNYWAIICKMLNIAKKLDNLYEEC